MLLNTEKRGIVENGLKMGSLKAKSGVPKLVKGECSVECQVF